jgi:hypothetical protein
MILASKRVGFSGRVRFMQFSFLQFVGMLQLVARFVIENKFAAVSAFGDREIWNADVHGLSLVHQLALVANHYAPHFLFSALRTPPRKWPRWSRHYTVVV